MAGGCRAGAVASCALVGKGLEERIGVAPHPQLLPLGHCKWLQ